MPFEIEQLDHVEVFVRDISAAVAWYDRVLGLKVVRRWDPEPVMIGAGGSMLALFKGKRSVKCILISPRSIWHDVCFGDKSCRTGRNTGRVRFWGWSRAG